MSPASIAPAAPSPGFERPAAAAAASELEPAACPLCGADAPAPGRGYEFPPHRVVQCSACSLWYLSPRLAESAMLAAYTRPDYYRGGGQHGYAHDHGAYREQEATLRATFARFVRTLRRAGVEGGRLLELGAGYGFLLDAARGAFADLTGTDYDAEAVAAMRRAGHRALVGGVEVVPVDERFDVIVSVGVIEHVYRPVELVAELARRLARGGRLVLATPQMGSPWLRLLGRRWPSFKIPEHVAYYDAASLAELLRRGGATSVRRLSYWHAFPAGLLAAALGARLPAGLAGRALWVPATMVAAVAGFDRGDGR